MRNEHFEFVNGDDYSNGYLRIRKKVVTPESTSEDLFREAEKWEIAEVARLVNYSPMTLLMRGELMYAGGNLITLTVGQGKIRSPSRFAHTNFYPVPVVVCRFGIKAHRVLQNCSSNSGIGV